MSAVQNVMQYFWKNNSPFGHFGAQNFFMEHHENLAKVDFPQKVAQPAMALAVAHRQGTVLVHLAL